MDDIIIAGEDDVPDKGDEDDSELCSECGSKLEWLMTAGRRQIRYCPVCDDKEELRKQGIE